jgi:N-acetyl-gamma-glutamyl-phosphate reductase
MTQTPIRAAICGATGYLGVQCVEILDRHPAFELTGLHGRSSAGRPFAESVPGSRVTLEVKAGLDVGDAAVVFAALPHTVAAAHAREWLDAGKVVVDMSADFRLRDAAAYSRWYGVEHPAADLCAEAVYSLVELERGRIRSADLLAVPGCYPTASLLATVPAFRAGLVETEVVVDAKSGVSGRGRSPSLGSNFAEVNESVSAYGVAGHRHKAEMLQELAAAAGAEVRLTFVPHLIPMTRGILVTAYLHPKAGHGVADIAGLMRAFCAANPFLRYDETPPATKSVTNSNVAAVNVTEQDGVAVVTVAEDNLVKGGAGQAVQAANVRFGLEETAGLLRVSAWP